MLKDTAETGLQLIQDAIMGLLSDHPEGLTNAQIARELGLQSNYEGHHQGYLSWTVIGILLNPERLRNAGVATACDRTDRPA
jgi:hypothetical protein